MNQAQFWFDPGLDEFLLPERRGVEFAYSFQANPSLKHLIEAMRVPHTEIGELIVNQHPSSLSYHVQDGDRIRVYPLHTRCLPNVDQPRFILDNHLGKLAIYLRMLGFDTLYRSDIQDDELAERASFEQRILLTRDRGLLMRRNIEYGYYVRSMNHEDQVVEVLIQYPIRHQIRPFQRCLRCNEPLVPVDKAEIMYRLEPLTQKYYDEFHRCQRCDRIFWKGSHYERMLNFIQGIESKLRRNDG